jgi:hypothetical protein
MIPPLLLLYSLRSRRFVDPPLGFVGDGSRRRLPPLVADDLPLVDTEDFEYFLLPRFRLLLLVSNVLLLRRVLVAAAAVASDDAVAAANIAALF